MADAVKDLSKENAILALSTASVSAEDQKAILIKAGMITAEEADALATNADTVAKTANFSITNMLKVAWAKLTAVMYANPFVAVAGAIAAVTVGIIALVNWLDKTGERAKEAAMKAKEEFDQTKSEIDELNSSLETTKKRIDELKVKKNLSLVEAEELNKLKETNGELERELRIKQAIADHQREEANNEAVKYFNSQVDSMDFSDYSLIDSVENTLSDIPMLEQSLNDLLEQQKAFEKEFKKENPGSDYTLNADWMDLQSQIQATDDALKAYHQFVDESIEEFMEMDDSLVEGMDDGLLNRLDSIYELYDKTVNVDAQAHTNTIKGILEKVEFQDDAKKIQELGENGELSVSVLTSGFPELISYLEKAGIEAEELYQYMMASINPDAINYSEAKNQLLNTLGISQDLWDRDRYNDLVDGGFLTNESLEAFLTVKAKFTDAETEYWNAEDWKQHIQEQLDSLSVETPPLSVSETIDQLNTQFKPAFDSLKTMYLDVFTDDGFTLENVDLSMLDSVKSTLDDLNESGISIDYDSFDNLAKVLKDSSSTAEDVHSSINSLATDILGALAPSLSQYSGDNYRLVQNLLESIGIMNSEEVMISTLGYSYEEYIAAKEEAAKAGFDLANANESQISAFVNEALEAGNCGEALALYQLKKQLANSTTINTASDVQQIMNLASAAGMGSEVLTQLANANNILSRVEAGEAVSLTSFEKALSDIESVKGQIYSWKPVDFGLPKNTGKSSSSKAAQQEIDVMSELSSQMDKLQSAYKSLCEIRDTYNESGRITMDQYQELTDMGFGFLANLIDENGQLGVNAQAFEKLSNAKLQEMQIQLARNAIDTINGIKSETEAVEYLTYANENLRDASLSATEALLREAQAVAHTRGEQQALAADQIVQGYEASKALVGKIEFGELPEAAQDAQDSAQETYNWIENLLDTLAKKTSALIDKADKFISWQKKNSMINRAVKAGSREITQNQNAYQAYMAKANSVGLSDEYIKKIQEGRLSIEELADESLSAKIKEYQEWYDKAQDVLSTIDDLYDKQRDLIRQKLDNVLDYYNDLDSYLSSVTSKVESLISLNEEMGKRSSLTDLLEQFASLSDQLESVTSQNTTDVTVPQSSLGDSGKVADAANRDRQKLVDSIKADIANLSVDQSGNYTRLLGNIAKTQAQIDKYIDNGWDVTKAKQFDKLTAKLQDYYDLQSELDRWATSNTVANYEKTYTAYQKLQNKLDSGKTLTKSEQKKYDLYTQQIEALREQGSSSLDKLYAKLADADGSAAKQTEADRIKSEIESIQSNLEGSATYQNLLKDIETVEDKIAKLDEKGYDNLSKSQKKTYDKLRSQLEAYYAQKTALDENATAANVAEYNKIYLAWKKLQDKLDKGSNLSVNEWQKYNQYTKQLEGYADAKADTLSELNDRLTEALNPGDKLEQITRTYEESAGEIYKSYQSQIAAINGDVTSTKQYQELLAKAQKLEQKKDTKGLSKSEQASLDKYNAELEALRTGGMSTNISEYMKTWEAWYKLQQKLDDGKKLSASEAAKYDAYKAQLEAWNREKQTQIDDLLSLMENDLQQLQKTYTENISEAESEINDYYADLYSLAKQIAEYNITTLKTQLDYLDSYISYYKELISLYDTFSGDKLTRILTDLDENALTSQVEVYERYLAALQDKYNATRAKMSEYNQLLDALETNDFGASMELFNKALEDYRTDGNTAMADKLQSVLDLLNERAVDADNWGEYTDEWLSEWEEALASTKQELISTASEIQDVNDALRELRFENITNAIEELDRANGILSSIAGLIQDDLLFDDGELSEYGRAKVALLVSQLENAQAKANEYLRLYNEIQNNKDTYASDKAYSDALNEALQNYYDSLGDAASFENSILNLMKKNSQAEINSLKNIIDARKKALQAKKDYYDYDKTIKNSQKEIDSLKAQIAALESLSDATDAATKAKLAQLKAQLQEKEEALQETKDEHTFNLQIDALDKFADSLSDALDNSTKSVEEILREQKEIIESAKDMYRTSSESVNETLDKLEAFYSNMGYTIDGMDYSPGSTAAMYSNTLDNTNPVVDEATDSGALVQTTDNPLFHVADQNMFELMNNYIPPMVNVVQTLPACIRERNLQPVVNLNYDSLIRVEGNVDKSFANELTKITQQICEFTKNDIYRELQVLK